MSALVFDIGGTNLRSARVTNEGIGDIERVATPKDPREAIQILAARCPIEQAVGGVAGVVTIQGDVTQATNLPSWNDFPFDTELEKAINAPVSLANDAELAGLGEAVYGAGKGYRTVAYIGLGTGVGTACIKDGVVQPHTSEGEGRQKVMTLSDSSWLEDHIGGNALTRTQRAAPKDLSREVWNALTPLLAEGIENAIRVWNPDVIVLSGSLMNEENGFRLEDVKAAVNGETPIFRGTLKDEAGLWGARALVKEYRD